MLLSLLAWVCTNNYLLNTRGGVSLIYTTPQGDHRKQRTAKRRARKSLTYLLSLSRKAPQQEVSKP